MNISILTAFPELYDSFLSTSLIGKAEKKGLISCDRASFFDFVGPKERVDAPSYGPGPGMLIKPDVVQKGIELFEQKHGPAYKIFFSPHGTLLNHRILTSIADQAQTQKHVLFVAGRYEGMDARVEQVYADTILSIGNFVLMGGDLPAMITIEGMLRFFPGIVGKQLSVEQDSFAGPFVDYPEYTQPVEWHGLMVPEVLRSGNHAEIAHWRQEQAAQRTVEHHFEWLRSYYLTEHQKERAWKYIPHHYAALLHTNVMLPTGQEGTTSVTSFDIHDGARSALTYGLQGYFIVTPLKDQQSVVQTLINFWQEGVGVTYNPHRYEAMKIVSLHDSLQKVIDLIEQKEHKKPILIGTSAKTFDYPQRISFFDQGRVWESKSPVLFLFGTGKGITPELLAQCDYVLDPIEGFTTFNHLSVRSAMAIVYDRWFGINPKGKGY